MPRIPTLDNLAWARPYVIPIFKSQGRDFSKCELCKKKIKRFDLHHTKYEGATIHDLLIVCHGCNAKSENRGLV